MLRLPMFISGVAFVAIVSLPGVSLGEHARHGFQPITASHVSAQRGTVHGGPIRVPHAPELDSQVPAKTADRSDDSAGLDRKTQQKQLLLARNTNQAVPLRENETEFVSPPVVPGSAADPSMPQVLGGVLSKAFPDRKKPSIARSRPDQRASATPNPEAADSNVNTPRPPADESTSVSSIPTGPESKYRNLEIEVSHSSFLFKLYGVYESGKKDLLKECKVALGAAEFPTPVGVYFVTHIYDKDPLWIPPPDRPWAWGQSPSDRVYGGTMAPLLKKRPVTSKKKTTAAEDYVEEQVRLDDYGYRFHGTNQPRSIGHRASHGCVRMLPKDAAEVARLIKDYVGAPEERTSENGSFVVLRAPVRLNLIK